MLLQIKPATSIFHISWYSTVKVFWDAFDTGGEIIGNCVQRVKMMRCVDLSVSLSQKDGVEGLKMFCC